MLGRFRYRFRIIFQFSMASFLTDLKERTTCPICKGTYTNPKLIVCLHTFCCECLEKHAAASQRRGKFHCPECECEIAVPEGNRFDHLPTSALHNNLLSLSAVLQSGDGSEVVCGNCKKTSAETSYCFDCVRFMCPVCLNAHERLRSFAFEGHKVTSLKQFGEDDYDAFLRRNSFCSERNHEEEVANFYCLDCQRCICRTCINTNHNNHHVDLLEKVADKERAKIMAGVELLKEKKKAYLDMIRDLEEQAAEIEAKFAAAKLEVSQAADEMIAEVRAREREAISALDAFENSRDKLNSSKKRSP